ncbi:hypothetical protein O1611_g6996 [Lasiodiplodia mahajangana]|uniref:Uncharacterized protein n=1 Tax=Lasiodiplodia mahajangana TaxID=1108764 RepID=A0ACC2JGR0_9PEZI|nr:hypothetical protein O1611_g6996 [Lasiodiplodia mahajangana]
MSNLASSNDIHTIPSSLDTVYSGSSAPLAQTTVAIRALLRRTKSNGHADNTRHLRKTVGTLSDQEDEDQEARGGPVSPVRANSKRRRSVAPISRSPSEASYGASSTPHRLDSVELGSTSHRDGLSRFTYRDCTVSTPTSGQRSPSRGRTRKRDNTPYSSNPREVRFPQRDVADDCSRRRRSAHDEMTPVGQAEYPASPDVGDFIDGPLPYIRRGVFRLSNHGGPQEFRFPKSKTQPEPFWQSGDGFSGDELAPDFVFLMAGKYKRKRSRSLSAFGQLSVEAENAMDDNATGLTPSQPYKSYGSRRKIHYVGVKDVWPTRENFAENSVAQKSKAKDRCTAQSTPPTSPKRRVVSRHVVDQVIPRKRRPSDFENFGRRKRGSQSRHTQHQSLLFTTDSQEHEYQTSDDEYYEGEDNERCEGEESESEIERESVANDETEHTSMITYDFGCSNISSQELGKPVGPDEDMRHTIRDPESYEVDSSPIHLADIARSATSRLGGSIYDI